MDVKPQEKKKILVMDDEPQIRKLLRHRLEYYNFEVYEAEDGEDGIKKMKELKPDLAIVDIGMPKMNGYDVCRVVRKDPDIRKTPIIVLTASTMGNDKLESLDAGANAFVCKPFDPELLIFKVNGFFGKAVIKKLGQ